MLIDLNKIIDREYVLREPKRWPLYNSNASLDRRKFVTASEIGTCARKVKFDKLALEQSDYNPEEGTKNKIQNGWGFFERGHTVEAWAVGMMVPNIRRNAIQTGINLIYAGDEQVSFADGYQSGTPDGVFMIEDGRGVGILELKSIDPRTNERNLPKREHLDQVMQNLDLVSAAFGIDPIGGELLYVNASDYSRRHQFHVAWDEAHAERLEARAQAIMEAAGPEELEAEGLFKGGCDYCAHTSACSAIIVKKRNEKGSANVFEEASRKLFG